MLLSLLIHFFSDRSLGTFFRRFRFRFRFFFCFRDYVIPFPFPDSGFHVLVLPHIVGKKDNYFNVSSVAHRHSLSFSISPFLIG